MRLEHELHVHAREGDLRKVIELMPSMFTLELVERQGKITYDPPLEQFAPAMVDMLQAVVDQLADCRELQVCAPREPTVPPTAVSPSLGAAPTLHASQRGAPRAARTCRFVRSESLQSAERRGARRGCRW